MKFLVKLLPAKHGICWLFWIKIFLKFSEQRNSIPEVLYRSSCWLINAVMKYLSFRTSASKLESVNASLLEIALRQKYFSKKLSTSEKQWYWKMHLDGRFWKPLYFGNIPEWLLVKDNCKVVFINSNGYRHILYISNCGVILKRNEIFFKKVNVLAESVSTQN